MRFFIKCNPPKSTAQGSSRILKARDGRMFVGKAKNSKGDIARNDLIELLRPYAPKTALESPLRVKITWTYPWRKSEKKSFILRGYRYCDTRPDCDNLMKLFFDCMTRLRFWNDDSNVSDVRFIKKWGNDPGIDVEIGEMI